MGENPVPTQIVSSISNGENLVSPVSGVDHTVSSSTNSNGNVNNDSPELGYVNEAFAYSQGSLPVSKSSNKINTLNRNLNLPVYDWQFPVGQGAQPSTIYNPQVYTYPSSPNLRYKETKKKGFLTDCKFSHLKKRYSLLLFIAFVILLALIGFAIFASIKPCQLTKCHERASQCINRFPFWAQCICDAGYSGNGKSHCVPCGQTKSVSNVMRIIGGKVANKASWPFAVYINQHYKGKYVIDNSVYVISYKWSCGGTIVNQKTILTAAHCIHDDSFEYTDSKNNVYLLKIQWNEWYPNLESTFDVYVGAHDIQQLNSANRVRVRKINKHENFDENTLRNDVATIQLEDFVDATSTVQYACLPPESSTTYPTPYQDAYIVGWGRVSTNGTSSSVLRNSKVFVYEDADCSYVEPQVKKNWDAQVCAGVLDGSTDTCQGDSGGGLFTQDNFNTTANQFVLSGIVSYGDGCAKIGKPGIYSRTSYHLDWIRKYSDF